MPILFLPPTKNIIILINLDLYCYFQNNDEITAINCIFRKLRNQKFLKTKEIFLYPWSFSFSLIFENLSCVFYSVLTTVLSISVLIYLLYLKEIQCSHAVNSEINIFMQKKLVQKQNVLK